jgi:type IV pilus assembly protein PilN
MMIRINLLPTRQAAKRESGRQYLVVLAGAALLTLGANLLVYNSFDNDLKAKQTQLADRQRRIAELDKVIGEVNKLKERRKDVQAKLDKLDELKKKKSGPVRMMDALAITIPKKVWVTEFVEDKGGVKLMGGAETIEDVSDFMKSLGNVVWSPKGMARVVERKRDAPNYRIELIGADGSLEEFPVNQLGNFFNNVELKSSEKVGSSAEREDKRYVKFELSLTANYAI